jgi:ANTAR domain
MVTSFQPAHPGQAISGVTYFMQQTRMLMQAFALPPDDAFDVIKSISQNNNVKVRNVARRIVDCWVGEGPRPDPSASTEFLIALRNDFNP